MSKENTFYFSHDYNTRSDMKIQRLITKKGYLGYGLFWALIENLYNNANALPLEYDVIAFDLRTDEDTIKCLINDFDLFIIKDGYFGSNSVQRRLDERNLKSEKARESALNRWKKPKEDASALPTQSDSNAIKESKVKESKVKESKDEEEIELEKEGKEIKDTPSAFSFYYELLKLGAEKQLVSDWLAVRKKKKLTNTETALKGFLKQVDKSGNSLNDVLTKCIEKSWGGFEADWYKKEKRTEEKIRMF